MFPSDSLEQLAREVIACQRCPRLRRYCQEVARIKKAAFRDWDYWGLPIPGFGDPRARLLVVGLAPAAHGANRTGRMFTGDLPNGASEFLMQALHQASFARLPTSLHRDDGLRLQGCYLTALVRCAPPQNRPLPEEFANCHPYLVRELRLLSEVRAILALGAQALHGVSQALRELGLHPTLAFAHGAHQEVRPGLHLFASYHPSQQNTQTGRLTAAMFNALLREIKATL